MASSEIIDNVEIIDSNLPVENNQKATEVFSKAAKENAKVSHVINRIHDNALQDVVPVARLKAFRALKLSRFESFRALKFVGKIGRF